MALVRGHQVPNWAYRTVMYVGCPEAYCRAAATWPCTSKMGNVSATPHVARTARYYKKMEQSNDPHPATDPTRA